MTEFWARAIHHFEAMEPELNRLDAATGDGDHGATILKGLRAVGTSEEAPAKAFRVAAGGASGSLFAQVIAALAKADGGARLGEALSEAAERIAALGQARPGEKTLLDALIPASHADDPAEAAAAAASGRDATREMAAKRGRARYVEGAGVGHVDPGAASVAALLKLYADWKAE